MSIPAGPGAGGVVASAAVSVMPYFLLAAGLAVALVRYSPHPCFCRRTLHLPGELFLWLVLAFLTFLVLRFFGLWEAMCRAMPG